MSQNRLFAPSLSGLLLLATIAAGGEVYKWQDEQGQTHYSNQKPTAVDKFETLEVFDSASSPPSAPDSGEELARIKELTRQLAEDREARERQRLEDRVNALEESYQQLLQAEDRDHEDREIWTYAPPYYYPPVKPYPPWWIRAHRADSHSKPVEPRPPFRQPPRRPPVTLEAPPQRAFPAGQKTVPPAGAASQKAPPAASVSPGSLPKP